MERKKLFEIHQLFDLYEQGRLKRGRLSADECAEILHNNEIIIYGAGNSGTILYNRLRQIGIEPFCFMDNKGSIYGNQYLNCTIYNFKQIMEAVDSQESYVVIVTLLDILSFAKIKDDITSAWGGTNKPQIYYFSQFRNYDKIFNLQAARPFSAYLGEDRQTLFDNRDKIYTVFSKFNDVESKRVYQELMNFYMAYDFVDFTVHPFIEHYFDYSLYRKIEDELFVDCGAFNGDTLDIFRGNNATFLKYIAIEADRINYEALKSKVEKLSCSNIVALNSYVSDGARSVSFENAGQSYSASHCDGESIYTQTLDNLVYDEKPTFIKVNVEGADLEALLGAKAIIRDFHPVVAIQGHHKMEHLWRIVEVIDEFAAGEYEFYLRNYSGIMEFTFYAVPKWRRVLA